jgi:(p)ppGpp synthase/HD superfamily hydrolase
MNAYTPRVQRAMQFAAERHEGRIRQITGAAFITHPLAVVLVLADAGFDDEDVLVSAVLHDVVEDEPVDQEEIAVRFGDRVGELVGAMTEPDADAAGADLPWGDRKSHIVDVARTTEDSDLLALKAADLICNATDLAGEHARVGDEVFTRFGAQGGERQLGYYLDLARTLVGRPLPSDLAAQIGTVVASLEGLSARAAHITAS